MKLHSVFLVFISLFSVYGAPSTLGEETLQTLFSQKPLLHIPDVASEWLSDTKKAILKEKKNLEKWFHNGRQYIKQDDLLCTEFSPFRDYLDHSTNLRLKHRWIRITPWLYKLWFKGNRA